jgi:hypothetical protein
MTNTLTAIRATSSHTDETGTIPNRKSTSQEMVKIRLRQFHTSLVSDDIFMESMQLKHVKANAYPIPRSTAQTGHLPTGI